MKPLLQTVILTVYPMIHEIIVMNCMYCQDKMKLGKAPFHIDRKGYNLVLDEIPAWLCNQCGESYFGEAEIDSIQLVIQAMDAQLEKLAASA